VKIPKAKFSPEKMPFQTEKNLPNYLKVKIDGADTKRQVSRESI